MVVAQVTTLVVVLVVCSQQVMLLAGEQTVAVGSGGAGGSSGLPGVTHGLDRLQSQVEARGRTQTSAIRMAALMVAG